jgi:hypothetical protein
MTVDELIEASRHLNLADQSRLLAALAQQLAVAMTTRTNAEPDGPSTEAVDDLAEILQLADTYGVATGTRDHAHHHDHYLYGTPKQETDL